MASTPPLAEPPTPALPAPATPQLDRKSAEALVRPVAAENLHLAPGSVVLGALGANLPFPAFRALNPGLGAGGRAVQQGIPLLVVDGEVLVGREGFAGFVAGSWRTQAYPLAAAYVFLYLGDPGVVRGAVVYDKEVPDPAFYGDELRFSYSSGVGRNATRSVRLRVAADGTPTEVP